MTEERVQEIAELEVRRYFDVYLRDTFPVQMRALREHTYTQIEKHDGDRKAHGGAERKINRLTWGIAAIVGLIGFIATLKSIMG